MRYSSNILQCAFLTHVQVMRMPLARGHTLRATDPDYKFHESRDHVGLVHQNEWHTVGVKSILVD